MDRYAPDYAQMKAYGDSVCAAADAQDPQYMFLRERLNALDNGWCKLDEMWRHRQLVLSEALNLEIFKRDAKQAEQLLANQSYYLREASEAPVRSLDEADALRRRHHDFLTSARANKDKLDGVLCSAKSLCNDGHRDAERIAERANHIAARFAENEAKSGVLLARLRHSCRFYQLAQECDELREWLECKQMQAHDESYRDTANIHMKYLRHKGFEAEIQANRNRLDELERNSDQLFVAVPTSASTTSSGVDAPPNTSSSTTTTTEPNAVSLSLTFRVTPTCKSVVYRI